MSAAHQIAADDSAEGTKYFFTGGSNRKSPNRISSGGALTPGLAAQGVTQELWEPFRQDLYKLPSLVVSCAGCCADNGLCCGASGLCFDSPQKVKSAWFTAMQELCARHAARFAPLGITLRPWLDHLERRSYKFPGILLAYVAASVPAAVVTQGAAVPPAIPTVVAPPPYAGAAAAPTGAAVQGYAPPPPQAVQAEVVAVAPMDRK